MKKLIPAFTLIFGVLLGLMGGFFYASNLKKNKQNIIKPQEINKYSDLDKNLTELEKDYAFYEKFDKYMSLLEGNDYDYINEKMKSIGNSEETQRMVMLFYVNEIQKDERAKNILLSLKNSVNNKLSISAQNEEELFKKNNDCATLITGIKDQLAKKYSQDSSSFGITEVEQFEFIFYSENLQSCIYTSNYQKRTNTPYSSQSKTIAYNASSGTKIKEFLTYCYECPLLSEDKANKQIESDSKEYNKFVLENSGYNIKLLAPEE